jgi:hypothetical protein
MKRLFRALLTGIFILPFFSGAGTGGTWVKLVPTPTKRKESSSALVSNKIYLLGGLTQKGISNKIDVWTSSPALGAKSFPFPVVSITQQLQ